MSSKDQKIKLLEDLQVEYRSVFEHAGPVLDDLESQAHIGESSFRPGQSETLEYIEGRRSLLYRIRNFLELDLETLYLIYEKGMRRSEACLRAEWEREQAKGKKPRRARKRAAKRAPAGSSEGS